MSTRVKVSGKLSGTHKHAVETPGQVRIPLDVCASWNGGAAYLLCAPPSVIVH